jgi:hypothetical protein
MFSQISWSTYIIFIVLASIAYYIIIVIKFFPEKLRFLFGTRNNLRTGINHQEQKLEQPSHFKKETDQKASKSGDSGFITVDGNDITFREVEELTVVLKKIISDGVADNLSKPEIVRSIQSELSKYYFLKHSPFSVAINNLIASEFDKLGVIHLNPQELLMVWNK